MEVLVKSLEPGQQYILQARAKDPSGGVSAWSTGFRVLTESDIIPPNPVTNLSWSVNGTAFYASWNKPTLDSNGSQLYDLAGFLVTVTANSISKAYSVGPNQESFDFSFEQNVSAFGSPQPAVNIEVRAFDRVGNLSTPVDALAVNPPPSNVSGFTADGIMNAISLAWDASAEDDFKAFELHMDTSGSGFTPDGSNLISKTRADSYVLPTNNSILHHFKLCQVDVFNQRSPEYVSASATPELSTDLDTTPPDAPTAVEVTTDPGIPGRSVIKVEWTASGSSNLADYVVRYSADEIAWRHITVPSDQTSAEIHNLPPGADHFVAVASKSFVATYSSWVQADIYPIETAVDNTPPSKPSAPSVSIGTSLVQVSHDMTKDAGGDLEPDVARLEVHGSTTTGFTPSEATLFGTIDSTGQGIPVSGTFNFVVGDSDDVFWRVIAVDLAGNKSVYSEQQLGTPGLIEGINIADATITDAKIQNLSAAKLIAGTAFINNLSVQSKLTIDHVDGSIESDNFDQVSKSGWRLDQSGLTIYDGEIAAKSLVLQDSSNNLTLPPFADFEFAGAYYHNEDNEFNSDHLTADVDLQLEKTFADFKTGRAAMRVFNADLTNPDTHDLIFGSGGFTTSSDSVDVNPGEHIFSVWAKKNDTPDQTIVLGIYTDTDVHLQSAEFDVDSASWTRYSAVLDVPSGVDKIVMYLVVGPKAGSTGYDILIDAVQLERKLGASNDPSPWKPPSSTVIDGGAIVTGSIRSSASAVGAPNQPAWSLNTEGNFQAGDALVRGRLVVGSGSDLENSFISSADYSEGFVGWRVRGDGSAEFNEIVARGSVVSNRLETISSTNLTNKILVEPGAFHPVIRFQRESEDAPYYASTPHHPSFTGESNFELILDLDPVTWRPDEVTGLARKYRAADGQRGWALALNPSGRLGLTVSADPGDSFLTRFSTEFMPNDGDRRSIKATFDAAANTVLFYTATNPDGPWTQLGDPVVESGPVIVNRNNEPMEVGRAHGGSAGGITSQPFQGTVHEFRFYNGTPDELANPVFSVWNQPDSFTDSAGRPWTVQSTGFREAFINFAEMETSEFAFGINGPVHDTLSAANQRYNRMVFWPDSLQIDTVRPNQSAGGGSLRLYRDEGELRYLDSFTDTYKYVRVTEAGTAIQGDLRYDGNIIGTGNLPLRRLIQNTPQTFASSGLFSLITGWQGNHADGSNEGSRITLSGSPASRLSPTEPGVYLIIVSVGFDSNVDGRRAVGIRINDTAESIGGGAGHTGASAFSTSMVRYLTPGDYVEGVALQTSGSNLDTNTGTGRVRFEMYKIMGALPL